MRICLIICLLTTLAQAGATTQPVVRAATQIAQSLGRALAEGDAPTTSQHVAQAPVRTLASHDDSDARQLAATFTGTRLISARAYAGVPATLAADMGDDFSANQHVPQPIRQRMTPADMTRANAIASRWVQRALKPQPGQIIGVLVFYQPPVLDSADGGRVLFGLLKFQPNETDVPIVEVVYGDPALTR